MGERRDTERHRPGIRRQIEQPGCIYDSLMNRRLRQVRKAARGGVEDHAQPGLIRSFLKRNGDRDDCADGILSGRGSQNKNALLPTDRLLGLLPGRLGDKRTDKDKSL